MVNVQGRVSGQNEDGLLLKPGLHAKSGIDLWADMVHFTSLPKINRKRWI